MECTKAMSTMTPPPLFNISRTTRRAHKQIPRKSVSTTRTQSLASVCSNALEKSTPALLNRRHCIDRLIGTDYYSGWIESMGKLPDINTSDSTSHVWPEPLR